MRITDEMVERATMTLLGHTDDAAPTVNWQCDRQWKVNDVRRHMRAALDAALNTDRPRPLSLRNKVRARLIALAKKDPNRRRSPRGP